MKKSGFSVVLVSVHLVLFGMCLDPGQGIAREEIVKGVVLVQRDPVDEFGVPVIGLWGDQEDGLDNPGDPGDSQEFVQVYGDPGDGMDKGAWTCFFGDPEDGLGFLPGDPDDGLDKGGFLGALGQSLRLLGIFRCLGCYWVP
jgi:hypothetical protein